MYEFSVYVRLHVVIYDRVVSVAPPITSDRLVEQGACALCVVNCYMFVVCVVSFGGEYFLFGFARFGMCNIALLCASFGMECGPVKFCATSRAFGGKVGTAIRVHKSIVDYSDPAEMLATYWRGLEMIPTYVDHVYLVNYQ